MQLSKGAMIGIVVAAVVVLGGLGYFVMNMKNGRSLSPAEVAQQQAVMEAARRNMPAKSRSAGRPGMGGNMPGGMGGNRPGGMGGYYGGAPGAPGAPGR